VRLGPPPLATATKPDPRKGDCSVPDGPGEPGSPAGWPAVPEEMGMTGLLLRRCYEAPVVFRAWSPGATDPCRVDSFPSDWTITRMPFAPGCHSRVRARGGWRGTLQSRRAPRPPAGVERVADFGLPPVVAIAACCGAADFAEPLREQTGWTVQRADPGAARRPAGSSASHSPRREPLAREIAAGEDPLQTGTAEDAPGG
jgi:hypothetical protein